jgi:hypothetical protein
MSDYAAERKVLADELAKQVNALSEQKKALQSELKQIQEVIREEEWKADKAVATAKQRAENAIAAIEASVLPHRTVQQQVEASRKQLHLLRQSLETETQRLKHERQQVLDDLSARIAKQSKRLSALHEEEAAFKARVNA